MNNEKLTLSVKEAAVQMGISKNLAYSLVKQGKMPGAIKLGQKRIVVSRIQIERLLSGQQAAPNETK